MTSTTPQFFYNLITQGPDAFDEAAALFRTTDEAVQDVIDALPYGFGALAPVIKKVVESNVVLQEWAWFKRILADTFLLLLIAIGTLFAVYLLS